MADAAIQVLVDRLAAGRSLQERAAIEGMLLYLGRSSLPVLRIEDEYVICGEVDQFKFHINALISLWQAMRNGTPIDWSRIERA